MADSTSAPLRLFVGVELDASWADRLGQAADDLRQTLGNRLRWVRPELYHVTVVFLGDQAPERVPEIGEALAAAAGIVRPFPLRLANLRRLGGHERGAIVVSVDDPSGQLQALRAALGAELRRHSVRFDDKPLTPHITLGRPRNNAGRFDVPPLSLADTAPLQVSQVALIKSELLPTGPIYAALRHGTIGAD